MPSNCPAVTVSSISSAFIRSNLTLNRCPSQFFLAIGVSVTYYLTRGGLCAIPETETRPVSNSRPLLGMNRGKERRRVFGFLRFDLFRFLRFSLAAYRLQMPTSRTTIRYENS